MSGPEEPSLQTVAELFEGHYAVDERLPWNGLSLVFRARRAEEPVAVAVLPIDCESAPERAERFAQLVASSEALEHPRIVRVRDHGVRHGVPFVEMELDEGRTLAEELEQGPMPAERAYGIARQILDALGHAHALGVLHCDLTPANVLVRRERNGRDRVRVVGFGLAQVVRRARDTDTTGPTGKGSGPAATRYLAPELLAGDLPSARADLYSVGALLHHMLTGSPPSSKSPAPPEHARAVLAFALASDPSQRFDGAAAMASALEDWLAALMKAATEEVILAPDLGAAPTAPPPTALAPTAPAPTAPAPTAPARTAPAPAAQPTPARSAPPASLPPVADELRPKRRGTGAIAAVVALLAAGGGAALWTLGSGSSDEPTAPPVDTRPAVEEPAPEDAGPPPGPLDGEVPAPLADLLGRIEAGERLDREDLRVAYVWARDHQDDPRPHLVLARAFVALGWNSDAVSRYEEAWERDPAARRDARMLTDLVTIATRPESGDAAAAALSRIYGVEALGAVDRALEAGDLRREEQDRLRRVRNRLSRR